MYNKTQVIFFRYLLIIPVFMVLSCLCSDAQTMWMMVHEQENKKITERQNLVDGDSGLSVVPTSAKREFARSAELDVLQGWRNDITATIFWIGEKACRANPVHNKASSWDTNWVKTFGGVDTPYARRGYFPKKFVPKANPFYVALPYNDISPKSHSHKPEVSQVIWWYSRDFTNKYQSVCKGRWLAIKYGNRTCYAQWEDCGPFVTNDWKYVFKGEAPRKNRNQNAGIDLSPAIRDYLRLKSGQKVSWKFVEDAEVERGPWSRWVKKTQFLSKNP